jgi:hypothetical protein
MTTSTTSLSRDGDGLVAYELRHPFRDGTTHVLLLPASCPSPFGPAFGGSKSLPAISSGPWTSSPAWPHWRPDLEPISCGLTACSLRTHAIAASSCPGRRLPRRARAVAVAHGRASPRPGGRPHAGTAPGTDATRERPACPSPTGKWPRSCGSSMRVRARSPCSRSAGSSLASAVAGPAGGARSRESIPSRPGGGGSRRRPGSGRCPPARPAPLAGRARRDVLVVPRAPDAGPVLEPVALGVAPVSFLGEYFAFDAERWKLARSYRAPAGCSVACQARALRRALLHADRIDWDDLRHGAAAQGRSLCQVYQSDIVYSS